MLNNINFVNFNVKPSMLGSKYVKAPSFRATMPADRFEKAHQEPLTELEQNLLDTLNEKRSQLTKINLSKKTLQEAAEVFVLKKSELPYSYKIQGKRAFTQSMRRFLAEEMGSKNSFQLMIISDGLKQSTKDIIRNCGFAKINNELIGDKFYDDFKKFIAIIYKNDGQKAVDAFLRPYLSQECYAKDPEKLMHTLKWLYRREISEDDCCELKIRKTTNGYYNVSVFVKGELKSSEYDRNRRIAESKAIQTVLHNEGVLPIKESKRTSVAPSVYFMNPDAKDQAEHLLKTMCFLKADETLDLERDNKLITQLAVARAPLSRAKNGRIFHRLEFLGDSIVNNFIARFVREKELDEELTRKVYLETISNETFRRFAIALKLPTFFYATDRQYAIKAAPDMFEAIIATLYESYPEERVYSYLKQLFELKYKEVMRQQNYAE